MQVGIFFLNVTLTFTIQAGIRTVSKMHDGSDKELFPD